MKMLSDFLISNDEIYTRIYNIVALENRLPPASEIRILNDEEAIKRVGKIRETVMAFALPQEHAVWFRHMPPSPATFAHELIHLAKKRRDSGYEEVYGYNLAHFIVYLAQENITLEVNPLRLFEDVTLQMLAQAIVKVTNMFQSDDPRNVIRNYFVFRGVIPLFLIPNESNGIDFVIDENYTDDDIVITAISELLAAVHFDFLAQEIVFELLRMIATKKE